MKKKIVLIALLALLLLPLTGCKKDEDGRSDAVKFKEEYESLNKKEAPDGELYRTITIDEENPIVYTTYEEIANKIVDQENFLVYFGSKTSEYCRSVIPYLLSQAKTQGIDKIYYVEITTEEESEQEGTKALDIDNQYYKDIMTKLRQEKVIDSTLAVFINGEMAGKTSGVSSKQTDGRMELTGEMKNEMLAKFKEIYITYNSNRK